MRPGHGSGEGRPSLHPDRVEYEFHHALVDGAHDAAEKADWDHGRREAQVSAQWRKLFKSVGDECDAPKSARLDTRMRHGTRVA